MPKQKQKSEAFIEETEPRRSVVDEPWWVKKGAPTRWLSLAQTATYLGLSTMTINRYVSDEGYAHLKFPQPAMLVDSWRFDVNDLDAWLKSRKSAPSSRKTKNAAVR